MQVLEFDIGDDRVLEYFYSVLRNCELLPVDDEGSPRIELLFPPMYSQLVEWLNGDLMNRKEEVLALPIVQGYVFEERFLQCSDLHRLTISAVMQETGAPQSFTFSSLVPASMQQTGTLRHLLADNEIYHLRPKHPAIDGVCVAVDSKNDRYLLLLQVSLRKYRLHESKGKDIRNRVDKIFEGKVQDGTIAEYYKHLAKVEQDENVIFVYVSPNEDKAPTYNTFAQDLKKPDTETSSHFPQYFYGFCVDSNNIIQHCLPPGTT